MDTLPSWVYVATALVAGLFGNQFFGRFLEQRLKHIQEQDRTAQEQEAEREKVERDTQIERERADMAAQGRLLEAVIVMVKTQSKDLTELLRASLKANQAMANNIGQLAMAIEGQGRDDQNRFVAIKEGLERVRCEIEDMSKKLDRTNDYTAAIIRAMGANLEEVLNGIEEDRSRENDLQGETGEA